MNFGEAIEALKQGRHAQRTGWNTTGMFVFLTKGSNVPKDKINTQSLRNADARRSFVENQKFPSERLICDHIDMMAADGTVVIGWLASQPDMLAEDWHLL